MKIKYNTIKQNVIGKLILLSIALPMFASSYAAKGVTQGEAEYAAWLKEFVTLRVENKDSSLPLMKIKDYYSQLSDIDKGNLKNKIIDHISLYLKENQKNEAMAMIDLYDFLADKKDAKRPDIYFIRGNIYAERQDTIMLKETIAQIENSNGKQEYLDKLNDYLLQIRRFVPADQGLDGYWVSDVLYAGYGILPKYIINARYGETLSFTVKNKSSFLYHCITTKNVFSLEFLKEQVSQQIIPYAKDSLYVLWSSEKLKNYDPELVGGLRQTIGMTGAAVVGKYSQHNKYSSGDAALAQFTTGIVEIGANALLDVLFTPSKKIYLLEARLKRVNENIFAGKFIYRQTKVKETTTSIKFDEEKDILSLLRWSPESGIIFMGYAGFPVTPYETSNTSTKKQKKNIEKKKLKKAKQKVKTSNNIGSLINSYTPENYTPEVIDETIIPCWKEIRDDASTEYGKAYLEYKKSKDKNEYMKEYNLKQLEKLREYNMEQANKHNKNK